MKSLLFRSMWIGGLCSLVVASAAYGQMSGMKMPAGEASMMPMPPKSTEREATVTRVDKTSFAAVDSAGKRYVLPLEEGTPPPAVNARIKIRIWVTLRPPGGGIEVSW